MLLIYVDTFTPIGIVSLLPGGFMQLSSLATTQQELVDDIVTLILQRAAAQRAQSLLAAHGSKVSGQHDHAATVLRALADDVKAIKLAAPVFTRSLSDGF